MISVSFAYLTLFDLYYYLKMESTHKLNIETYYYVSCRIQQNQNLREIGIVLENSTKAWGNYWVDFESEFYNNSEVDACIIAFRINFFSWWKDGCDIRKQVVWKLLFTLFLKGVMVQKTPKNLSKLNKFIQKAEKHIHKQINNDSIITVI